MPHAFMHITWVRNELVPATVHTTWIVNMHDLLFVCLPLPQPLKCLLVLTLSASKKNADAAAPSVSLCRSRGLDDVGLPWCKSAPVRYRGVYL